MCTFICIGTQNVRRNDLSDICQRRADRKFKKDCAITGVVVGVLGFLGVAIAVGCAVALKGDRRIILTTVFGLMGTGLSILILSASIHDLSTLDRDDDIEELVIARRI